MKHLDEVNRIASRLSRQADDAAYEMTSGVTEFLERLIADVESGQDVEMMVREARNGVAGLWDAVDISQLEARLVKVQHAALEAGWNSMIGQNQTPVK